MERLTLSVSVLLVFQRAFHRVEKHRATRTINVCGNDINDLFYYNFMFP